MLWKILAGALVVVTLVSGIYFKISQDELEKLNKELGQVKTALDTANNTIQKQQADLKQQGEILDKTFKDFNDARQEVNDLVAALNQNTDNLNQLIIAKPTEAENKVNESNKRLYNCLESIINGSKINESSC